MLKSLISLFAESFLKNKSEWVGRQSYPSTRIQLSLDTRSYVPPSDGYIGFYKPSASDNTVDVYSQKSGGIVSRFLFVLSSDTPLAISNIIKVEKGVPVIISCQKLSELWFSPTVGSN